MNITSHLQIFSNAFLEVFYPNMCQVCKTNLNLNERHLCLSCTYDLPYIGQNKIALQKLEQLFWGRVAVENVFSLLNYQKGNSTQHVLQALKYYKKQKLGHYFGAILGETIVGKTTSVDFIVPVPLHPKKERQRGFNQSLVIAKGLADTTKIKLMKGNLIRNSFNLSQTKFSKYDRWDNVRQIFSIRKTALFENKHILLVDDVLTTGATIEACAQELLKIKGCSVSIATLAARM